MNRFFALALIAPLAGCAFDDELDTGADHEALVASFSSFNVAEAGWDEAAGGSIARVFWTGAHCDDTCVFEVNANNEGWVGLGRDQYRMLSSQLIEIAGLRRGVDYRFRATIPEIPPRTTDTGDGTATTTPGYPAIVSPEAQIVAAQRRTNVTITVENNGFALSPFFNDVDRTTGQFIPQVIQRSPLSYAFYDGGEDGEVFMTPLPGSFQVIEDASGQRFDWRDTRLFGPAQSFVFEISDPSLGSVFDWQPMHSNRLANDGRQANLVIVAVFESWTTTRRPQFVAVHVPIDKRTGAPIGNTAVTMLAGDLDRNDRADHRVILAAEPGEPPVITRWDWQATPNGGLPRVTGAVTGVVEFDNPNGVLDYQAEVTFEFDIDVNTYW